MIFKDLLDSILEEEERAIGKFLDFKVMVFYDEGDIPHCHLKSNSRVAHPRLDEPGYLYHNGDVSLNSKERKLFDRFMSARNILFPELTNWECCALEWNKYSKRKITSTEKPDYTQLPDK